MSRGALHGVKVLDLSRVLAGPWAGRCWPTSAPTSSRWNGPAAGDDTRAWGPPWFGRTRGGGRSRDVGVLPLRQPQQALHHDRHRRRPRARPLVRSLAAEADVVLENFKVGGLRQYGLDYASLRAINPRLVYCSITGLRPDGSLRAARRLRLPDPGHGRADERHWPPRRRGGRRSAEGGRGADRRPDRPVRHRRRAGRAGASRHARARASTSTSRCWTCRSPASPTRRPTT